MCVASRPTISRAALVAAFVGGACLPAFAPPIRAHRHHGGLTPAAADPTCLTCHPTADETHGDGRDGGPPIVPMWMVFDRRGCVDCHDVREPRR